MHKSPYFEEKSLTYLDNEFLSRQIKAGFAGWPLAKFGFSSCGRLSSPPTWQNWQKKPWRWYFSLAACRQIYGEIVPKFLTTWRPHKVWPGLGFSRARVWACGPRLTGRWSASRNWRWAQRWWGVQTSKLRLLQTEPRSLSTQWASLRATLAYATVMLSGTSSSSFWGYQFQPLALPCCDKKGLANFLSVWWYSWQQKSVGSMFISLRNAHLGLFSMLALAV